jgi:RNA polymerase sigma-70 factor (ECF subfamily)
VGSEAADQSALRLAFERRSKITAAPAIPSVSTDPSDEELVLRMERGDRAALEALFDRYFNLIFGIALRILHDRSEAEDLVQDIFLRLFEKVRGFDPSKGSGRTWIVQIAYRKAFDRRASLKKRPSYDGTEIEEIENTFSGGRTVEEKIADCLTGEQLHAAFEELEERQRRTLELYFFEGLDLREISERMGETFENARHFYYRGLDRLRKLAAATREGGVRR